MDESVSNIYFLQRCRWIEFSISYEDVKKSGFHICNEHDYLSDSDKVKWENDKKIF